MKKIISIKEISQLNKTDWDILSLLVENKRLSIGELTRQLSIAPINNWKHLKKLKELGFIEIPNVKRGKKKYISILNIKKNSLFVKLIKNGSR